MRSNVDPDCGPFRSHHRRAPDSHAALAEQSRSQRPSARRGCDQECDPNAAGTSESAPNVLGPLRRVSEVYIGQMRRAAGVLLWLYLLAALVSKALEKAGVSRCGCSGECWCRRPGLSAFRWVFPFGHR